MIQTMKNYLKAAGIKKVKFSKLWEGESFLIVARLLEYISIVLHYINLVSIGCKSNSERAHAMLRLLRDKGLVGEPTMAKCRELKMKMQVKREIDELDTSVILDTDSDKGNSIPLFNVKFPF